MVWMPPPSTAAAAAVCRGLIAAVSGAGPDVVPAVAVPPRYCRHTFTLVNTPIHTVHKHALKFPLKLFPTPGTHKGIHSQLTFTTYVRSTLYTFQQCISTHILNFLKTPLHVPLSPTPQRHLPLVPSLSVPLPRSSTIQSACLGQSHTLFFRG